MKKVEPINVIMLYINNQVNFTFSGIMKKFNNSPWAALRVIREIKIMGILPFKLPYPSIPKQALIQFIF